VDATQDAQAEDNAEQPRKQRKKVPDPEYLRIRELRAKEEARQIENDTFISTQSTFSFLAGSGKKTDVQVHGEPRLAKILPPVESVINLNTGVDSKPKSLVVLTSSQIDSKETDLNCTYPKKVVMRDLL